MSNQVTATTTATTTANVEEQPLVSVSFKDFCKENRVTSVGKNIKFSNPNGYPYITLVWADSDGVTSAFNLFFTKRGAEVLEERGITKITRAEAVDLYVVDTIKEGRENILKLSFKTMTDTEDLFGDDEDAEEPLMP